MISLAKRYRSYGFEAHKGYGTRRHLNAIAELGPCHAHRMSFTPVKREAHRIQPQSPGAIGRWAESFAAAALEDRGMKIVGRNFRTRFGEVDLIAADGGTLCFVEVRARKSSPFGTPTETVTASKARRIIAASQEFLQQDGARWQDWRIDVAAVELDHWSRPASVGIYRISYRGVGGSSVSATVSSGHFEEAINGRQGSRVVVGGVPALVLRITVSPLKKRS